MVHQFSKLIFSDFLPKLKFCPKFFLGQRFPKVVTVMKQDQICAILAILLALFFQFFGYFTGGTTRAQSEDVTGSTPLHFVNDCVNFTTTVSARFWLMDCRNVAEATKMATELYREAIHVPFMAKWVLVYIYQGAFFNYTGGWNVWGSDFWLETKVIIIKISTQSWYPRTFDLFSWKNIFFSWKKNIQNCRLKRLSFSKSQILNIFLWKFHVLVLGLKYGS